MGINHLRISTTTAGDLLSSLVSMTAAVVTAAALHPLLAPVVLFSALPQGWATIRSAKIAYRSFLDTSARIRRLGITADLGTNRSDAAEVRAFTTQNLLLGEHRRIAADLTHQAVTVEYRTTGIRLLGRTLAGLGSAAAYLVLGALIYTAALHVKPRVSWRAGSHAPRARCVPSAGLWCCSYSRGGTRPSSPCRRRWLYQSMYATAATSRSSSPVHGPLFLTSSALNSELNASAMALS